MNHQRDKFTVKTVYQDCKVASSVDKIQKPRLFRENIQTDFIIVHLIMKAHNILCLVFPGYSSALFFLPEKISNMSILNFHC